MKEITISHRRHFGEAFLMTTRDLFVSEVPRSTLTLLRIAHTASCKHSYNSDTVSRLRRYCLSWQASLLCARIGMATPPIQLHTSGAYLDLYPLLFTPPRWYTDARLSSGRYGSDKVLGDPTSFAERGNWEEGRNRRKQVRNGWWKDSKGRERIKCRDRARYVTSVTASASVTVVSPLSLPLLLLLLLDSATVCSTSGVAKFGSSTRWFLIVLGFEPHVYNIVLRSRWLSRRIPVTFAPANSAKVESQ